MKKHLTKYLFDKLPLPALEQLRKLNKHIRNLKLNFQSISNNSISTEDLLKDLQKLGVRNGDVLLVHCSLSKIGHIKNGAHTLIGVLRDAIGETGTLLMPSFPAPGRNKDYLLSNPTFDLLNTKSNMGIVSEVFRQYPQVKRSFHPTDSICALGPEATFLTYTHFDQLTPYNENSPLRKHCEMGGKILLLGTTLNSSCTSLHVLEDFPNFTVPVYDHTIYNAKMIDENGKEFIVSTKVHDPQYSARRNCDALKPIFKKEGVIKEGKIGNADSILIDAKLFLNVMVSYYEKYGVTMYTPFGNKNQLK